MKNFKLVLIFSLSITLNGCLGLLLKNELTEKNGAIPTDFGKDSSSVLLCVLKNRKGYDENLIRIVKKFYKGKCEFITSQKELDNSPYLDKTIYRFVFNSEVRYDQYHNPSRISGVETTSSLQNYILDRKENKRYSSSMTTAFNRKLITVYMKNLEKKRNKP